MSATVSSGPGLVPGRWSQAEESREWSCGVCTFVNKPLFLACDMCGQARPTDRPTLGSTGNPSSCPTSCGSSSLRPGDVVAERPSVSAPEPNGYRHCDRPSHGSSSDAQRSLECLEDELFRAGFQQGQVVSDVRTLRVGSNHGLNLHAPIIIREDPNDYPSQHDPKKDEEEEEDDLDVGLDSSYQRRYRPTSASDDPTMDESMDRHNLRNLDVRGDMRRSSAQDGMSNSHQSLSDSRRSMNSHSSYNNRSFNASSNVPLSMRKQAPTNSLTNSILMNSQSTATTDPNSSYGAESLAGQNSYSHNGSRAEIAYHGRRSDGLPVITRQEAPAHRSSTGGAPPITRAMPRRTASVRQDSSTAPPMTRTMLRRTASVRNDSSMPPPGVARGMPQRTASQSQRARPHMSMSFRAPPPGERGVQRSNSSFRTAAVPAPAGGAFVEEVVVPSMHSQPRASRRNLKVHDSIETGNDDGLHMECPGDIDVMKVFARDQGRRLTAASGSPTNNAEDEYSTAKPRASIINPKDRANMLKNLSKTNPMTSSTRSSARMSSGSLALASELEFDEHPLMAQQQHPFDSDQQHQQGKNKMKGTVKGLMAAMRISKKGHE